MSIFHFPSSIIPCLKEFGFLTIVLLCSACGGESKSFGTTKASKTKMRIVESKGLPSELLLVVDKEVWQSDVADTLRFITQGEVPGLMQQEDYFRVTRILSQYYTRKYTTMHSKLFVRLDPSLSKPILGLSYDVTARPQVEVTVSAPSLAELRGFLSRQTATIRQIIGDAQLDMRAERLRKHHSPLANKDLKDVLGYSICAPEEIRATKKGKHFLWAGSNQDEKDLNLVVYTCPWDGTEVCTAEIFTNRRDSVMRANIPGSEPDQWMQTTRVNGRPVVFSQLRNIGGAMVQEVRGLWEMRNGALGGPFVSLVRIDTAAARLVISEGFVYSPSTDKRDLLRMVEASLRTLKKAK